MVSNPAPSELPERAADGADASSNALRASANERKGGRGTLSRPGVSVVAEKNGQATVATELLAASTSVRLEMPV
jgi:hypothetical protein